VVPEVGIELIAERRADLDERHRRRASVKRSVVPEVGIELIAEGRADLDERRRRRASVKRSVVPEVGIEPTRGVNPTGF
jgi:hypothetical protein